MKRYLLIPALLLAGAIAGAQTVTVGPVTRHAGAGTGAVLSTHADLPSCAAAVAASAPLGRATCKVAVTKTASAPAPASPPASSAAPAAPPDATGYSVAARIAAIRAHSGYGAQFADPRNPAAPQGLVLPTPPRPECMATQHTADTLADFNRLAAGACARITLRPSAAPYVGWARITGQDIEAIFTGATIAPDDDSWALQVTEGAARVKTVGGSFGNLYLVGGNRWSPAGSQPNTVQDVHIYGATFAGAYTHGRSATYYGDGANIRAHRFLLERASSRSANGGFFVESGSTNIVLANSSIVVPKLARHENPVRINGGDLVALIDSRLRTELGDGQTGPIKHTWRMHGGTGAPGGRLIVLNVQSEGGGAMGQYPGVEYSEAQSAFLAVQGWRYYRAPGVEGNNIAAFPHRNIYPGSAFLGAVMNAEVWMDDNIVYFNDQPAGSPIMAGQNVPPGSVTRSVYAPYQPPPAWAHR